MEKNKDYIEDDAYSKGSEIYTRANVLISDIIEEKQDVLSNMMRVIFMMQKYKENRYFEDAIEYITNVFCSYLREADIEHRFYINLLDYIEQFEFLTDFKDEKTIEYIEYIMNGFESYCESRLLSFANVLNFYDNLIACGILTNSNYYCEHISGRIDEEEEQKILSIFPKK